MLHSIKNIYYLSAFQFFTCYVMLAGWGCGVGGGGVGVGGWGVGVGGGVGWGVGGGGGGGGALTSSWATSSHEADPCPSCVSNQSYQTLPSCPYAKTYSSLSLMVISNVHIFHLPQTWCCQNIRLPRYWHLTSFLGICIWHHPTCIICELYVGDISVGFKQ